MSGTLYTSNFSNIRFGKGILISVALYNPSWLKKGVLNYWFRNLAPDATLLYDYKDGKINWDEYVKIYAKKFYGYPFKMELKRIEKLLKDGNDVTIYCYEGSDSNCHRHIIGRIFKKYGYNVEEI